MPAPAIRMICLFCSPVVHSDGDLLLKELNKLDEQEVASLLVFDGGTSAYGPQATTKDPSPEVPPALLLE